MNVGAYLERIGHRGGTDPNAETLRAIHRAHMLSVPFENLDIALGRPIELSLPGFYDKIVVRRRGGFCYELNGLFAWLLGELGFPVVLLSARVFGGEALGPDYDHMLLLVRLEERWIADVGFGDSFLNPLPMDDAEQVEDGRSFRIIEEERALILERDGEPQYAFTGAPRKLAQFEEMCRFQQTSPLSTFTRKTICSLPTADGRITLSNGRLITTVGGRRDERPVASHDEYRDLLRRHFGIELEAGSAIERLMDRS